MAGTGRAKGDGRGRLGGRVKGTPNKVTSEVKNALAPIVTAYISGNGIGAQKAKLADDLAAIKDPADRARIMKDLIPYVIPKLSSVEIKDAVPVKTFREELDEMREETQ